MKKIVIVGAGDRGNVHASYALKEPDKMTVVGVVEPNRVKLEMMRDKFAISDDNCFSDIDDFLARDKFADAVVNATMDELHVKTSVPILRKGYDLLLEKPFAVNQKEMEELLETVKETGRMVYICHVLRYAPFYSAIKKHLLDGDIGKIISIELSEHVTYHHMAVSYVRGKWRSEKLCFAPMLMAKSCHDIDLMMWMLSETSPISVASFGSDFAFGTINKPNNAGNICMVDCKISEECIFSAKYNYSNPQRWDQYTFDALLDKGYKWEKYKPFDDKQRAIFEESLKTYNNYGKCVWDFERDGNVDHQSVIVNFKNGATGVFNMVGGAAKGGRYIHIIGTKGEIRGAMADGKFKISYANPKEECGYTEKEIDVFETGDMAGEKGGHGGGDIRLMADFIAALEGKEKSISCTDIFDSTKSHLIVFKAEESRKTGTIINL